MPANQWSHRTIYIIRIHIGLFKVMMSEWNTELDHIVANPSSSFFFLHISNNIKRKSKIAIFVRTKGDNVVVLKGRYSRTWESVVCTQRFTVIPCLSRGNDFWLEICGAEWGICESLEQSIDSALCFSCVMKMATIFYSNYNSNMAAILFSVTFGHDFHIVNFSTITSAAFEKDHTAVKWQPFIKTSHLLSGTHQS